MPRGGKKRPEVDDAGGLIDRLERLRGSGDPDEKEQKPRPSKADPKAQDDLDLDGVWS